jgi:hypothetical protein
MEAGIELIALLRRDPRPDLGKRHKPTSYLSMRNFSATSVSPRLVSEGRIAHFPPGEFEPGRARKDSQALRSQTTMRPQSRIGAGHSPGSAEAAALKARSSRSLWNRRRN